MVVFVKIATVALMTLAGLAVLTPTQANAGTTNKVFGCSLGKKFVSITAVGNTLTYQFGTPGKAEMTIIGSAERGNVFYRSDRYAGMEYQLRFTNGGYSYIVYSMEGNGRTGTNAVSGLVVMKGSNRIADKSCVRHAEFGITFDLTEIPEDTEAYSAM